MDKFIFIMIAALFIVIALIKLSSTPYPKELEQKENEDFLKKENQD